MDSETNAKQIVYYSQRNKNLPIDCSLNALDHDATHPEVTRKRIRYVLDQIDKASDNDCTKLGPSIVSGNACKEDQKDICTHRSAAVFWEIRDLIVTLTELHPADTICNGDALAANWYHQTADRLVNSEASLFQSFHTLCYYLDPCMHGQLLDIYLKELELQFQNILTLIRSEDFLQASAHIITLLGLLEAFRYDQVFANPEPKEYPSPSADSISCLYDLMLIPRKMVCTEAPEYGERKMVFSWDSGIYYPDKLRQSLEAALRSSNRKDLQAAYNDFACCTLLGLSSTNVHSGLYHAEKIHTELHHYFRSSTSDVAYQAQLQERLYYFINTLFTDYSTTVQQLTLQTDAQALSITDALLAKMERQLLKKIQKELLVLDQPLQVIRICKDDLSMIQTFSDSTYIQAVIKNLREALTQFLGDDWANHFISMSRSYLYDWFCFSQLDYKAETPASAFDEMLQLTYMLCTQCIVLLKTAAEDALKMIKPLPTTNPTP